MAFGYFGFLDFAAERWTSRKNFSKSDLRNKRYPFAGFRCTATLSAAAHFRRVFCETPKMSAASAVIT
jgi:hypothetical protein